MPNYNRTKYYIDTDAVRDLLISERQVRGATFADVSQQTGINAVSLNRFVTKQQLLSGDGLLTVIKWGNGEVNRFVKRRGQVYRHTDTAEQRKLREGQAFLSELGVPADSKENPIDAMIRLLAVAKSRGLFDDGVDAIKEA
jgi:hypothetical protein